MSWFLEFGELDPSVDELVWNSTYIGADGAERGFKTAFKYVTKHSYTTVAKFITALQEGFSMATKEEKADGSIKHADLFPCSAWNPAADVAAGLTPADPEELLLTWGALRLSGSGERSAAFLERATTYDRQKVAHSAAIAMVLETALKEDRTSAGSTPIEKMWAVVSTLADIVSTHAHRVHTQHVMPTK